jgi:hypothetical protein
MLQDMMRKDRIEALIGEAGLINIAHFESQVPCRFGFRAGHTGSLAKNSLTEVDARQVEDAFRAKLATLEDAGGQSSPPTPSAPRILPSGLAQHAKGIDKSRLTHPEPRRFRDREHVKFVCLFDIQADHLNGLRDPRQVRADSREVIYALFGRADSGSSDPDPASHDSAYETEDVHDLVSKSAKTANNSAPELARCFLRLANLPNYALDRLSRYEATLWRQAGQILFALDVLGRQTME